MNNVVLEGLTKEKLGEYLSLLPLSVKNTRGGSRKLIKSKKFKNIKIKTKNLSKKNKNTKHKNKN